ncbi:MAG: PEPxxWA-CTERM sorting domain-containing protein [Caulobacteraceae bacterium]
MKRLLVSAAMVLGLAPAVASATTTTNWVIYGSDQGSGEMTLGDADNGGFDITSFTGEINGNPVTLLGGQPGWLPGPPNSNTPSGVTAAPAYSTDGLTYDNIYYPGDSPDIPCFGPVSSFSNQNTDAYGILFTYDGGEGEIWGNGTHNPYIFGPPGDYTFEVATGILTPADNTTDPYTPQTPNVSYASGDVGFQVGVPEPATWALMLVGFGGLGATMRSARRKKTAVLA